MAEKKIGAKIVIDGESEFRASMISAKKALDNFDSELNKINKTYKNNANSLEALRAKQQVYTKLQEEQTHKVSLLTEMQDKAVKKLEEIKTIIIFWGPHKNDICFGNISTSSSNLLIIL